MLNLELVVERNFNQFNTLWKKDKLVLHLYKKKDMSIVEFTTEVDLQLHFIELSIIYTGNISKDN